jgi:hypothetical protein
MQFSAFIPPHRFPYCTNNGEGIFIILAHKPALFQESAAHARIYAQWLPRLQNFHCMEELSML